MLIVMLVVAVVIVLVAVIVLRSRGSTSPLRTVSDFKTGLAKISPDRVNEPPRLPGAEEEPATSGGAPEAVDEEPPRRTGST